MTVTAAQRKTPHRDSVEMVASSVVDSVANGDRAQPCMGDLLTQPCRVAVERGSRWFVCARVPGQTPPCAADFRDPAAFGPAISDPCLHASGSHGGGELVVAEEVDRQAE